MFEVIHLFKKCPIIGHQQNSSAMETNGPTSDQGLTPFSPFLGKVNAQLFDAGSEASKVRGHLQLLREEYSSLQRRFQALEKRNQLLEAGGGNGNPAEVSFAASLLEAVRNMHLVERHSDAEVIVSEEAEEPPLPAHQWVLRARSGEWKKQMTASPGGERLRS